jgi:hypothetical protein
MFWVAFALWAATFALSQVLAEKAAKDQLKDEAKKAIEELGIPSTSETRSIPVGWGRFKISSPQLLWYGNYRATANQEEVETSMFNHHNVVVGWNYYLSFQFGLCKGPVALTKIWYGNDLVWEGYADSTSDISIPQRQASGGGLGTLHTPNTEPSGIVRFYPGASDQLVDDYLVQYQDPCPAYRDMAYVVIDSYIGQDASLQSWSFEVQANPNGLGVEAPTEGLLYSGTAAPDTEGFWTSHVAMKFVLAEKKRISYMRFKGRLQDPDAGMTWVDGSLRQMLLVSVVGETGGVPNTTKYFDTISGYANWNSEEPNDWIYIFIGGVELEAGTYYVKMGCVMNGIYYDAKSSESDEHTYHWNASTSTWSLQTVQAEMEVYGWDEEAGTSALYDVNPMNLAYELLTAYMGFSASDIDVTNFTDASVILDSESQGMGLVLQSPTPAVDVLSAIERQVDGHFYLDPVTGKWKIQLIRADFDIDDLVVLDNSNIEEIEDFSRGAWISTMNIVHLSFTNRDNDYEDGDAIAIDHANQMIQGRKVPASAISMSAVCTPQLASQLAWRELKSLSVPVSKAALRVKRSLWNLHIGQPVVLDFEPLGTSFVMRVTSMEPGDDRNAGIKLVLAQDIFTGGESTLTAPTSGWTPGSTTLIPFSELRVEEMPYALLRRQSETSAARLLAVAASTGKGETGYNILIDGSQNGTGSLTPRGLLFAAVGPDDTTIEMTTDIPLSNFPSLSDTEIGQNLTGLIMIEDELIAVRSSVQADYGLTLTVYRGICDTAVRSHAANVDIWMVTLGWGGVSTAIAGGSTVDVQLVPKNSTKTVAASDVTAIETVLAYRDLCPYPPTNLELNTELFPETVSIDVGATLATKGVTADFLRRDYRIYDEVSQLAVDAETIDPTFPANNSTQYCLKVYDGVTLLVQSAWQTSPSIFVRRTKILREADGYQPELTFAIGTQHTNSGTKEALQDLSVVVDATSEFSDDTWLGVLDTNQTSLEYTAPETGTYAVTLEAALDSDVYYKLNGGAWTSCVTTGNTSGSIAGVTADDIIEIRHADSTTADDELMVTIAAPTSTEGAYGIFVFTNDYWEIGGFGRTGFGTGPFGR